MPATTGMPAISREANNIGDIRNSKGSQQATGLINIRTPVISKDTSYSKDASYSRDASKSRDASNKRDVRSSNRRDASNSRETKNATPGAAMAGTLLQEQLQQEHQ